MVHPLPGAFLKVERAREQLKDIQARIQAFWDSEPYYFRRGVDEDNRHVWNLIYFKTEVPLPWSILLGEIAHNLRSALDHLIWQLAFRNTGSEPTTNTQFPIFLEKPKYESRKAGYLRGVSDAAIAFVEGLQPFATGENEKSPLWQLHKLSNWDKHRALALAVVTAAAMASEAKVGEVEGVLVTPTGQPLKDGAPLTGVVLPPGPDFLARAEKVEVKGEAKLQVVFQDPAEVRGAQPVAAINPIGERVSNILVAMATKFL